MRDADRLGRETEKEQGARGEEGVDHVEDATRSPQAPVKGPTAIRIRGALSDRDSQSLARERAKPRRTASPAEAP